jgi:hypothetical protein
MAAKSRLLFTRNFIANLDSIQSFLGHEGSATFRRLLTRIFDDTGPVISRFPLSGRSFLIHRARSKEAQVLIERLKRMLRKGDDIREVVVDDYVVLYLVRRTRVYFLAIRHHRQLSFDLVNL